MPRQKIKTHSVPNYANGHRALKCESSALQPQGAQLTFPRSGWVLNQCWGLLWSYTGALAQYWDLTPDLWPCPLPSLVGSSSQNTPFPYPATSLSLTQLPKQCHLL